MSFEEKFEKYREKFPDGFKQHYDTLVEKGLAPRYVYAGYKYMTSFHTQDKIAEEFDLSQPTVRRYRDALMHLINGGDESELCRFRGKASTSSLLEFLQEQGIIEKEDILENGNNLRVSGLRKVCRFIKNEVLDKENGF